MSYEVEAIADVGSTIPNSTPIMREERIFDPYQNKPNKALIGQSDIERGVKPVETKAAEETVKLSPQMALIARREQKFRQEKAALQKERATVARDREEIAQLRAMKQKLEAKDYSALDDLVKYDEYSQYQVNKLNGIDPVRDEIQKLNSEIESLKKNSQENVELQFKAAVQERRTATQELVNSTNQFPRIKKAQAHEAVVQHILDTWEHDSQELSVEQAAKEVEQILLEKAKQWASLLEDQEVQAKEEKRTLPPLRQGLKTLTNQVTAGEIKSPRKSLYRMSSDSERWAEARKRAEEKLQQRD